MKRILLVTFLLSACSSQAIITSAYPDREKFAFRSTDGEDILTYLCATDATNAATKKRAAKAHTYFNARFDKAVASMLGAIFDPESHKEGSKVTARTISKSLDAEMEDIVEQTEERYKCIFIDSREV